MSVSAMTNKPEPEKTLLHNICQVLLDEEDGDDLIDTAEKIMAHVKSEFLACVPEESKKHLKCKIVDCSYCWERVGRNDCIDELKENMKQKGITQ